MKAFYEVFRVAYTPEVQYYSVVCTNRWWTRDSAKQHIKAVLDNLKDPKVDMRYVTVVQVDLETVKDSSKLRATLDKQLEFSKKPKQE